MDQIDLRVEGFGAVNGKKRPEKEVREAINGKRRDETEVREALTRKRKDEKEVRKAINRKKGHETALREGQSPQITDPRERKSPGRKVETLRPGDVSLPAVPDHFSGIASSVALSRRHDFSTEAMPTASSGECGCLMSGPKEIMSMSG